MNRKEWQTYVDIAYMWSSDFSLHDWPDPSSRRLDRPMHMASILGGWGLWGLWTGGEILLYRKYVRKWWLFKRNRTICPILSKWLNKFLENRIILDILPGELEIFRKFTWKNLEFFLPGSTTPQISNQIDAAGPMRTEVPAHKNLQEQRIDQRISLGLQRVFRPGRDRRKHAWTNVCLSIGLKINWRLLRPGIIKRQSMQPTNR